MLGPSPSRRVALLYASVGLLACAPLQAPAAPHEQASFVRQPQATKGDRGDVFTIQDNACPDCHSALDLIKRFRPQWLAPSGMRTPSEDYPQVVVDDIHLGGIAELPGIPSADVQEMHFLTAAEANWRYGPGFMAGAIVIRTRRH